MKSKGDIGRYVKKGFFDPLLIVKVFERIKPEQEVKAQQTAEWIGVLNQRFENNIGKLHMQPQDIFAQIQGAINKKNFN